MRYYLERGRGGTEAAGEWKGREGGGNGGPGGEQAAGVRGAAAGVLGGGPARAEAAQIFGRTRAIGAAKTVNLKKNPTVLYLKLVFKKC